MGQSRSGWALVGIALAVCAPVIAGPPGIFPESRQIPHRPPQGIPRYRLPSEAVPNTVARKTELEAVGLSLDETIRQTLANAEVIRILTGTTAVASGRTIYDPAIANTVIDQETGRFDPALTANNAWNQVETPIPVFDPVIPGATRIGSRETDSYTFDGGLSKTNTLGGTARLGGTNDTSRFAPGVFPLDPESRSALDVSYTQPLLQGAGRGANMAPVYVARINTERSFYQLKDAVQDQVQSAIDGYWSLVFARVDVWVREQQVEQTQEALRVAEGRFLAQLADIAEVTQARTSLANFRAQLIGAQATQIQREAALRNLMGLPPADEKVYVPITPPRVEAFTADWDALCDLASGSRPDLIDLQLTLEADERLLVQARNLALPKTDAQFLYRWNGITGLQPDRNRQTAALGRFEDWTMGLNISVPLGLRQARAAQRQQELIVMRDRANLRQGVHAAVHDLATTVRAVDQAYEQYLAFVEARKAARVNLERQLALYRAGQAIYLNILQAITDWGTTISSEASALTQFNTLLATLEQQTGTILETHGVYFFEEQYGSTGPLGRLFPEACYPASLAPNAGESRYPVSEKSSENAFDLEEPVRPEMESPLPELPYREVLPKTPPRLPERDTLPEKQPEEPQPKEDSAAQGKSRIRPVLFEWFNRKASKSARPG